MYHFLYKCLILVIYNYKKFVCLVLVIHNNNIFCKTNRELFSKIQYK